MGYLCAFVALIAALLALNNFELADDKKDLTASLEKNKKSIKGLVEQIGKLNDRIDDKDAVILRQLNVIEAKDKELAYIGVGRNANGRLESRA